MSSESNDKTKAEVTELVTRKFGENAAKYATSAVHAKGASLARLVELVEPAPHWRALDVATAAGHTAFAFAPHVAEVVASDLTSQMLAVAAGVAGERGLTNVSFEPSDAEALPFPDASFDLVTSRIAPHHFPHPKVFVAEAFRVLKSGGVFAIDDNIVPDPESDEARAVGVFMNEWEKKRDPSHVRALPISEWCEIINAAGARVQSIETMTKAMDFTPWAERMNVSPADQSALLEELQYAGDAVHAFMQPDFTGADVVFHLTEGLIIARKP